MRTSSLVAAPLFLAFLSLQGGCVRAYYTRPGTLKPSVASVPPADRAIVWQHAVSALLDQGYVPVTLDEAAGYINAHRREDINDDSLVGTMATVVVSPEGNIRVEVNGTGMFTSEQDFVNAVSDRQSQILQGVMAGRTTAK